MGMFDKLGSLTAIKLRLAKPPNAATPPKITNGNGHGCTYRTLDEDTQARALARAMLAQLGIEIISVPATPDEGFTMGSTKYSDEKPVRQVKIDSFGLSETPITNAQYAAYLDATKQENGLDLINKADHPVVNMSWFDAIGFCNWLSRENHRQEVYTITYNNDGTIRAVKWDRNKKGNGFRLPTEAEWEYAARGLDGQEYPWGNEPPDPSDPNSPARANYLHRGSPGTTTSVGSYPAGKGPFCHLDLAGNVWEWCYDWYANYVAKDVDNPSGSKNGQSRVLRGGSWVNRNPAFLRCAYRFSGHPGDSNVNVGFRVAEDY